MGVRAISGRKPDKMPPYLLGNDIFAAASGTNVVLLDLTHDAYLTLSADDAQLLRHSIGGWPAVAANMTLPVERRTSACAQLTADMLSRGLITDVPTQGKLAAPLEYVSPKATLIEPATVFSPIARAGIPLESSHVWRFALAIGAAVTSLRSRGLCRTVHRVAGRKRLRATHGVATNSQDLRDLVCIFNTLRPFAYASAQACLLHSLSLIMFLRLYEIYPMWMFGVATEPFAAHSWVQSGEMLLNDSLERVERYTPIMAV
jgi:Transglutaminase-like superfamily